MSSIKMWRDVLYESASDPEFAEALKTLFGDTTNLEHVIDVFVNKAKKYLVDLEMAKAEAILKRILRYGPNLEIYNLLSHVKSTELRLNCRYDDAKKECTNTPQGLVDLAHIERENRNITTAIQCYRQAIKEQPSLAEAHVGLAKTLLIDKQWKEGFKENEWRFKYFDNLKPYLTACDQTKRWNGQCLEGKRIVVFGEQGLGDIIMFSRFLPELRRKGAYVILECKEKLHRLLSPLVDEIVDGQLPQHDLHCPMMSLPRAMNNYEFSNEPYLSFPIKQNEGTKIGIVWIGNPKPDPRRSIHLKYLTPLFELPFEFYSIQKDKSPRKFNNKTIDFQEDIKSPPDIEVKDFYDTAIALCDLDLLICCDTSIAHLGGAMNIPTWVLLPFQPDWRWEYPWYKSVRTYFQDESRQWDKVVENVKNDLLNKR